MDLLLQMASLGKWMGPKAVQGQSAAGTATDDSAGEGLEGVNLSFPSLLVQRQTDQGANDTESGSSGESSDAPGKNVLASVLPAHPAALAAAAGPVAGEEKSGLVATDSALNRPAISDKGLDSPAEAPTTQGTAAALVGLSAASSVDAANSEALAATSLTGQTVSPANGADTLPATETTVPLSVAATADQPQAGTETAAYSAAKGATALATPGAAQVSSPPVAESGAAVEGNPAQGPQVEGPDAKQGAAQSHAASIDPATVANEKDRNRADDLQLAVKQQLSDDSAQKTSPTAPAAESAAQSASTQSAVPHPAGGAVAEVGAKAGARAYAESGHDSKPSSLTLEDLQELVRDFQSSSPLAGSGGASAVRANATAMTNPTAHPLADHAGSNIRQQVVQQIATGAAGAQGVEKMTLQLNPENLGQVEIRFEGAGDKLSVTLIASGKEAEQALREGVKEVADAIVERSGRWQQVDIKVEQRDIEDRRHDRGQDSRKNDQQKHRQHDDGSRRNQDFGQQAEAWAETRAGV